MTTGLSRVTVVAPRIRVDLSLPSDVPMADLLPTILNFTGEDQTRQPSAWQGWTLSRLGGAVLDSSRSPAQLAVRDGELLYLRPRDQEEQLPVFDDIVDAVATAAQERAGRWDAATTRSFGLTLTVLALLGGAAVVLLAGPPHGASGLVGLSLAAALVVVATMLARAAGNPTGAIVFAMVALPYAAVGGLLVLAGDQSIDRLGGPHVLIATTAVILVTAVGAVGVGQAGPAFLTAGACATALLVAAAIAVLFGVGAPAAAAVTVTIGFALLPMLPMFSYRLGRLPIPVVPAGAEHLRQEEPAVPGALTLERSDRADTFLSAMVSALAVIGAVAAVVVSPHGPGGLALAAALGLMMMARARWFLRRSQRLPLLGGGVVALAATAVASFAVLDPAFRLVALLPALLVTAGVSVGFALAGGRRPQSPMWGRALDLLEMLVIVAILPLAMWVSGLYGWIRSIRG